MAEGAVHLRIEDRGGGKRVAFMTIDNAAKLNRLNRALMGSLIARLEQLAQDDALRCVVLTGAGERAFIGGANIAEMAMLDSGSAAAFITLIHQVCDGLRRLPVPVIARIRGYALGAGLEMAASCDMRDPSRRSPPRAVRLQKALIREWEELPTGAAVRRGISCFVRAWDTDEPQWMMRGYLGRMKSGGS